VSCPTETVTGWVDGELGPEERARVETHLATCPDCRAQAEEEAALRVRLRGLPAPEVPAGLEDRLRRRLRPAPRRWPAWLGLAAALLATVLWLGSNPSVIALELSRDHGHCFAASTLRTQVRASDPAAVRAWFAERGTPLPALPETIGELRLVGGRHCPLVDRQVAHIYYASPDGQTHLSLFGLTDRVRGGADYTGDSLGRHVRLIRVGDLPMGVVAESQSHLQAAVAELQA